MNRRLLIGRELEKQRLGNCMRSGEAQLIAVYGRRRVGKTFLINQFFEGRFDFKFTGTDGQPMSVQLKNFWNELRSQTRAECEMPKDWTEAFYQLRLYLESLPTDEKQVVFFDEMPWMDTPRAGFLSAFEYFWNSWGCSRDNLIFIICGSATSWMTEHVTENKGGLYKRLTCRIWLEPFTLAETEEYLTAHGIEWSRYDIAECYMIMGGIPYYLSLLYPELSYTANIDNIFFRKRAELWDEFSQLYRTLFHNSAQYISIVEKLASKKRGMTREELSASADLPGNGALTRMLKDLEYSGFVRVYRSFGKKTKEQVFQLSDYYTMFYFAFVKDQYGRDEHYWSHAVDNPARRAWAGLTFEQLCKDHIEQVKKKLGIAGVLSEESCWSRPADEELPGAQIDLLIDRRDHVINLCEIKFSMNEFSIDKDYDRILRNKIDVFRQTTGTKKTIAPTMITTYGVRDNKYSSLIASQVTLDDLFG